MSELEMIQNIEATIRDLVRTEKQQQHLTRGRVERTLAADLANALKPHFETEDISVDSSYNKHEGAAKRLNGKLIELDVAIHERGIDENNLVAIELETNNNPARDDIWKIEGLTQELDGYGYKLGLFLVIGIEGRAGEIITMDWYRGGELIK